VFEVGDQRVLRALNEAVVNMTEGERGVLTIPPHLGYTSRVRCVCREREGRGLGGMGA
jgi:FKBP-type peptidyl-prolyl cis-trans isomerase